MEEIWKNVDGLKGFYQVSNLGRVRSLDKYIDSKHCKRLIKGRIMKLVTSKKLGYKMLHIECRAAGIDNTFYIHRLVAKAFLNNPENKATVNHKNHIRDDNRLENLEWATQSENNYHSWTPERKRPDHIKAYGEDKHNAVLTNETAKRIVELLYKGISPKKVANKLDVAPHLVYKISEGNGTHWKHLGFDKSKCRNFRKALTERQVELIREMYHFNPKDKRSRPFTMAWLAKCFRVGETTIGNVIRGKNYAL